MTYKYLGVGKNHMKIVMSYETSLPLNK